MRPYHSPKHKKIPTFRDLVERNLRTGVACVAFFLLSFTIVSHSLTPTIDIAPGIIEQPDSTATVDELDKLELLKERYDCWDSSETEKPLPGRVLYSRSTMDRVQLGGPHVAGEALEQVFEEEEARTMTVYAFCP